MGKMLIGVDGIDGDDDVDAGADIDILAGGLTNLRLPPSLDEPHDQPYPTQPYATKLSQFRNLTKPPYHPLQSPNSRRQGRRHEKGNTMSGPPNDGAIVQCTTYDGYDVRQVRRTMGTTYDVRQYNMVTHAE